MDTLVQVIETFYWGCCFNIMDVLSVRHDTIVAIPSRFDQNKFNSTSNLKV